MIEIRIHGRGGQGAVTTGQILAIAAFYDKKQSQTFPFFGVERCGAPVEAFVRISDKKMTIRSHVYNPSILLVLDASLVKQTDLTKGLKENATIIINSNKKPNELGIKGNFKVYTIDATSAAMEVFKKPIVNTAMLGAFSKITDLVSLRALQKAVDDIFIPRKGKDIAELNKKAVKLVYERTKK